MSDDNISEEWKQWSEKEMAGPSMNNFKPDTFVVMDGREFTKEEWVAFQQNHGAARMREFQPERYFEAVVSIAASMYATRPELEAEFVAFDAINKVNAIIKAINTNTQK